MKINMNLNTFTFLCDNIYGLLETYFLFYSDT